MQSKSCPNCASLIPVNVKFCPNCGASQPSAQGPPTPAGGGKFCANCGAPASPDAKFCNSCGKPL